MSSSEHTPARRLEDLEDREALDALHNDLIDNGPRADRYYFPENDDAFLAQDALAKARMSRDSDITKETHAHAPVGKQLDNTEVRKDLAEQ